MRGESGDSIDGYDKGCWSVEEWLSELGEEFSDYED